MRILFFVLMMLAVSAPAFADEDYNEVMKKFCSGPSKTKVRAQKDNKFFKKVEPVEGIGSLGTGVHELDEDGAEIHVYEDGRFMLQLSPKHFGVRGTSYDDYMTSGQRIGGCSAEQMSEAIKNNGIVLHTEEKK